MTLLIRFAEALGILALVLAAIAFGLWGLFWMFVRLVASADR